MGVLHKFNPVRLGYIKEAACRRFERDPKRLDSLAGLRILDIGCGGGILSEPLARLGADMVGADPAAANIEAARLHAAQGGLTIDYRVTTAEALADAGERFDVVLAMEVVEHVADVSLFIKRCAEMVKPGGMMVAATLNRTIKSFALAIVGAEYVLGWLPRGTHQWDKFVTPDELEAAHRAARAQGRRRDRRDLQSDRRPLADLDRHGRQLHGDGGEAGVAGAYVLNSSWLWALFTVIAAAAQTVRNATQRELTTSLGTAGATHVRFLFGLPFALVFLLVVCSRAAQALPSLPAVYWPWILQGSIAQIAATALMLAAMSDRSFVVVYAYIKTEPVQAALFGLVFLGDVVTLPMGAAILIATTGVVLMALKPGTTLDVRATLLGIAAGGMFALSAVGYRGAILSLGLPSFLMAATFTLVVGLIIQCVAGVGVALAARAQGARRDRAALAAVAARRFPRRIRLAILVPGVRARHRRQRAHARAGRGAVRAGDLVVRVQADDDAARGVGHRADRDRGRGVGVGVLAQRTRHS